MSSLAVRSLHVERGGRVVLHGIDLEVAAGATLAVLGPSGGGKTTLLRAIAGLEPSAGRVILGGEDVSDLPPHRRGVGLMFQDHALFPHRSVGDNVAFGLRARGDRSGMQARRVAEVLELVGLAGSADRSVTTLSGGEAQRVALARALAPSPRVLCLDEPLASLDRLRHDALLLDLRRLLERLGVTCVHVTHDPREALVAADSLAVLAAGRLRQVGPASDVWRRPADAVVAQVLGLGTVVRVERRGRRLVLGDVDVAEVATTGEGVADLLIRPEALAVARGGEPTRPVVEAVVSRRAFAGRLTELEVVVPSVPGLPPLRVEVDSAGEVPEPGAPLRLVLEATDHDLLPPA